MLPTCCAASAAVAYQSYIIGKDQDIMLTLEYDGRHNVDAFRFEKTQTLQ